MIKNKKQIYGQYFTSNVIAEFMVSLISEGRKASKVLDPGAGIGVFLDVLKENKFKNVSAYEIDENLFKIVESQHSGFNIQCADFLSSSREERFEVIIGNPPYVHWNDIEKNTRTVLDIESFWKPYLNGEWDLLYAFIIWSVEKLVNNGELIFIVPYYWFDSTYAYSLRNYMSLNGYFELIIHMGEFKLFPDCAPNNIILKYIKTNDPNRYKKKIRIIEYNQRTGDIEAVLEKIREFIDDDINSEYIYEDDDFRFFFQESFSNNLFWSLSHDKENSIMKSIEKASLEYIPTVSLEKFRKSQIIGFQDNENIVPVNYILDIKDIRQLNLNNKSFLKLDGAYYSKQYKTDYLKLKQVLTVGVGMVTGFDEAFLAKENFIKSLNPKEKKLITLFMKGKACRRFWIDEATPYIFADELEDGEVLKEAYPNFYNHLVQYKNELDGRYKSKNTLFYQWATVRNLQLFKDNLNTEKLFVPCLDRHKKSRFSYTTEPYYGSGDVLVIVKKKYPIIKESLKYISAWLNSEKLNKWYKLRGSKRGHRTSYTQTRVEEIPIRLINWEDQEEVEIYDEIIRLFDEIVLNKEDDIKINNTLDNLITDLIKK